MVVDFTLCLYFLFLIYLVYSSFSLFYLLAVMFWWRSDLQPSLDRVRSASTTCLRPEPNFHFLDRDRYEQLLLLKCACLFPAAPPALSAEWFASLSLEISYCCLLLLSATKTKPDCVWGFVLLPLNEKKSSVTFQAIIQVQTLKKAVETAWRWDQYHPIILL